MTLPRAMPTSSHRSQSRKYPVYCFYGTRAEEILRARDATLDLLVPRDERDENLTEYGPTVGKTVELGAILDEVAADLATMSFLPGAAKCSIVTNPKELFASKPGGARKSAKKKKKKNILDPKTIAKWIVEELPKIGHHLVLLAFEDESEGLEVADKKGGGPVFKAIQQVGRTQGFRGEKAFFRIEGAIRARDANACIRSVRDLWGRQGQGARSVFNSVTRCLRFLIQANITCRRNLAADPMLQKVLFPEIGNPKNNIFRAHPMVRDKYLKRLKPLYRTDALLAAHGRMLEVYRAMRPRPDDPYVADAQVLLEQTLMELIGSRMP